MTTIILTKLNVPYSKTIQKILNNTEKIIFITKNKILRNYAIPENVLFEYFDIDYSDFEDSIYIFIRKIINQIDEKLPDKIGTCLQLKLHDYYKNILFYLYVFEKVRLRDNSKSPIYIIVDDIIVYKKLKNILNYNICYFNKKKFSLNFNLYYVISFIKYLWIEWFIIHLRNLFYFSQRRKIKANIKNINTLVIYDVYNESMIDKLKSYVIKYCDENILSIFSDIRIWKYGNLKQNSIPITHMLSFKYFYYFIREMFKILSILQNICIPQYLEYDINLFFPKNRILIYLAAAYAEYKCYLTYFIRYFKSAKTVISASCVHPRSFLILEAGKIFNIEQKVLQHGLPLGKYGYIPIVGRKLLVYSDISYDIFKKWGVTCIEKIELFNNKDYEKYDNICNDILVCLTGDSTIDNIILGYIKKFLDNYKMCKFRIRKHPGTTYLSEDFEELILKSEFMYFDYIDDSRTSIYNSRLVITFFSTIVDEALELNKNVIIIGDLLYYSDFCVDKAYIINDFESFEKVMYFLVKY